jgi:hypothetical protein
MYDRENKKKFKKGDKFKLEKDYYYGGWIEGITPEWAKKNRIKIVEPNQLFIIPKGTVLKYINTYRGLGGGDVFEIDGVEFLFTHYDYDGDDTELVLTSDVFDR